MKTKTLFVCQQCGQGYSKWAGRCQECGEWNSVVEERVTGSSANRTTKVVGATEPQPISEIAAQHFERFTSDISELDNVLGGGLVPGSAVLLGGEPGVGKSTLLLQAAEQYAQSGKTVLYVSGEESASQIALRSTRLGVSSKNLYVVSETDLTPIRNHIDKYSPQLLILDSIQTIYSSELDSQPGSVGQLRECAFEIISIAKQRHMAAYLVGHVTKEGAIAGPKVLEHMVDVVLYFEGTASQGFRLLRSIKNRFGSTNEIGVFEIVSKGIRPVSNPLGALSLGTTGQNPRIGHRRQHRRYAIHFSRSAGSGFFHVSRHAPANLYWRRSESRVIVGGHLGKTRRLPPLRSRRLHQCRWRPSADGASHRSGSHRSAYFQLHGKPIEPGTFFFGEVGLGGEVRSVPRAAERLKEGARIGLKQAFVPAKVRKEITENFGLELIAVDHVQELSDKL